MRIISQINFKEKEYLVDIILKLDDILISKYDTHKVVSNGTYPFIDKNNNEGYVIRLENQILEEYEYPIEFKLKL